MRSCSVVSKTDYLINHDGITAIEDMCLYVMHIKTNVLI
jgi:hypothetical protein